LILVHTVYNPFLLFRAQRRPGFLDAFRAQPQQAPPQEQPNQYLLQRSTSNSSFCFHFLTFNHSSFSNGDNNAAPAAAGEGQDAPNPAGGESGDGQVEGEGNGNTERVSPSPPEELIPAQVQQQQRFLDVARTFVMTFVTSLIPEMNP